MPIYEYQCEQCGERNEVLQKLSDPPLEKCLSCGGTMKKLMSAPAIQFKGSGWYITDYGRKNAPPPASSEKSPGGNGSSSSKSETKKETSTTEKSTASDSKPSASASNASNKT